MRRHRNNTLTLWLVTLTVLAWVGCVNGELEVSPEPDMGPDAGVSLLNNAAGNNFTTNNGSANNSSQPRDDDRDGYYTPEDCDDTNPNISPGQFEKCGDGIDNNCFNGVDEDCDLVVVDMDAPIFEDMGSPPARDDMGMTDPTADNDGDGFAASVDCDDTNPDIKPGVAEVCDDNIDNNCVDGVDEGCGTMQPPTNGADGDPCTSGAECQGGGCLSGWPGGYCSTQCSASQPCAAGSSCYQLNTNQGPLTLCLKDCSSSAQCREGYACVPTANGGACGPACRSDADCGQGAVCDTGTGQCVADPGGGNNTMTANNTMGNPGQAPATGMLTSGQITSAGLSRDYLVYVPNSYNANTPAPLLLAFHGNGDTAQNFYNYLQLGNWAEGSGFIVATFDGPRRTIVGNQLSWDAYSPPSQNADVAFANDVVNRLETQLNVDPNRIYVLGHSQGGFFAFMLGMTHANTYAAIAMQASANPQGVQLIQGAARKIPVWLTIGTNDGLLNVARQTRTDLQNAGHVVQYKELPGVGHGGWQTSETNSALSFLLGKSL